MNLGPVWKFQLFNGHAILMCTKLRIEILGHYFTSHCWLFLRLLLMDSLVKLQSFSLTFKIDKFFRTTWKGKKEKKTWDGRSTSLFSMFYFLFKMDVFVHKLPIWMWLRECRLEKRDCDSVLLFLFWLFQVAFSPSSLFFLELHSLFFIKYLSTQIFKLVFIACSISLILTGCHS